VIICALLLLGAAATRLSHSFDSSSSMGGSLIAVVAAVIAIGALFDRPVALRCLAGICLLLAFILPLGFFNPFSAGDYYAEGREPPTVFSTLVWMVPTVLLLLFTAFLIDPPNKRRTWPWRRT
jgi:hypothetical protein